jgi:hypothetical protein
MGSTSMSAWSATTGGRPVPSLATTLVRVTWW